MDRRRIAAAVEAYRRGKDRVGPSSTVDCSDRGSDGPEWSPAPAAPRFGVGVASRLEFHRGPHKWRPAAAGAADSEISDG